MKSHFTFFVLLFSFSCYSQTLSLKLSLPQPRLGQTFYISFSSDTLSKQIFNLPPDKFEIDAYAGDSNQETALSVRLKALKTGKNVIGPLSFNFNGKHYKTDAISFIVADALPDVEKGVWIRKVVLNDTTVYVLIDQRIPTHNQVTQTDNNTLNTSAVVNDNEKEVELLKEGLENARIEEWGSSSETSFGLSYASFYKCYKVTILDKNKPLVLTKKAFANLQDQYQFQNMVIN